MQVEIHQAVQQQTTDGGDGRGVDRPRKMTLLVGESLFRIAKQNPEERGAAQRGEQTHFGEQLHVVVVDMIDDQPVVKSLESRVDRHERTQSAAHYRMSQKDVRCAAYHGGPAGQRNVARMEGGKPLNHSAGAQPSDQGDGGKTHQRQSGQAGRFRAAFSRAHHQGQNHQFEAKTNDSAARTGENQRSHRDDGQQAGQRKSVAPQPTKNHEREADRDGQLRESSEVITIYEGPEGVATQGEFLKPINCSIGSEALHDAKQRNPETQEHQQPGQGIQILPFAKRLGAKEKNQEIGDQLHQLYASEKRIGRDSKNKLSEANRQQTQQRPAQRI